MKRIILSTIFAAALAAPMTFAQDGNGEVYKDRSSRQQGRIVKGEASGQLTPHEAGKLENNKAKINGEVARDKAANGGELTNGEKAKVHHQMKNQSRDIAAKKHNNRSN